MAPQYDFIAHMNWMKYNGDYIPERIAFAPTYESEGMNPLVVCPKHESLNKFSYEDILKNLYTYPLNAFHPKDETNSVNFQVPIERIGEYLGTEFYRNVLSVPDSDWTATIGTYDFATFLYLDKYFPEKVVTYLGDRWDAETVAAEQAKEMIEKEKNWV